MIEDDNHCSVDQVSSIYETKPFGLKEQDNFLNAVVSIKTSHSPQVLYILLKEIEKELGRTDTVKWGPREIDLDILFYNDLIYTDENITIPHGGINERDFVLVPLCELDPLAKHPITGMAVSEIDLSKIGSNIINKFCIQLPDKWTQKKLTRI